MLVLTWASFTSVWSCVQSEIMCLIEMIWVLKQYYSEMRLVEVYCRCKRQSEMRLVEVYCRCKFH